MLIAVILGTGVMVNAQTEPAKRVPVKEVGTSKHSKHKAAVKATKAEKKAEIAKEKNNGAF